MARSVPTVRDGYLQLPTVDETFPGPVVLESAPWYAWLEQHRSFCFEAPHATLTVRKERRPGGWYWYAYRHRQGKLHTAYLGKSAELTLERLNETAAALERKDSAASPRISSDTPPRVQAQEASVTPLSEAFSLRSLPRPVPKHNLPVQFTSLVGREQDAARAVTLLRRPGVRLLSMIGTAGIGKTRLALQVATDLLDDFTDGVSFVSLAPIRDPELVLATIARTIGLKEQGDEQVADRLKVYLRKKHSLLVLDNFEHVMIAAPLLVELLEICPLLKLLVTSRQVLRLRAEQQFLVPPLAHPDLMHLSSIEILAQYAAVDLFIQRAQATQPDFQMTEANAHVIAEICSRLDGLPLAIELAAARSKLFSPSELLARLDSRLQVLVGGPRDLPERQQTLRSTIEWSYDLLHPAEQRLFRRLAVFIGGWTLEAIEAVCTALDGDDRAIQVLDGVTSLLDKSLLQRVEQTGDGPRLRLLETIREYGLERLASCGEEEDTQDAHAMYYVALAERAEPDLAGPQQVVWLERLEREHDNLRAALRWLIGQEGSRDHREMALRLAGALERFWLVRGHLGEGWGFLKQALSASEGIATPVRAKALNLAAFMALLQDNPDEAEDMSQEGLALSRDLGDQRGTAHSLFRLGGVAWQKGDLAAGRSLFEQAMALLKEVGDGEGAAWVLFNLALLVNSQGEYARARALLEESVALSRERGDKWRLSHALFQLASTLYDAQGEPAAVRLLLTEHLAIVRELGDQLGIATSLQFQGQVTLSEGDAPVACSLLEESVALCREFEERAVLAWPLLDLARAGARRGDHAAAQALYQESLAIAREMGSRVNIPSYQRYLEGLADVIAAEGEPAWAAQLWGAAESLR